MGTNTQTQSRGAVAIDVNTGEVLAMASYLPTTPISCHRDIQRGLGGLTRSPTTPWNQGRFITTIQAAVPPGSTFKMALAVAALQEI